MTQQKHQRHTHGDAVNNYNLTEPILRQGDIPPGIAAMNFVELTRITITFWRNYNE